METKCESTPAWFRKEHPMEVREDIPLSAYSSDGEFGVMMDPDVADLDVQAGEVAFLFGKNKDELWFRPHFGLFFKVSFNSEEEVVAAKLYDRPTGVFRSISLIKDVHVSVPVYHDALYMVPVTAAGEDDDEEEEASNQNGFEWDEEDEKAEEARPEPNMAHDEEIREAVYGEMGMYGGSVIARHGAGNDRLYSYDIVEVKNRLFVLVYADFNGKWLADEEAFAGESPLWFSEQDHKVSPVFQAMRCRDFFRNELPGIAIDSMVVLSRACIVVNEDEMQGCWRWKCNTTVVRTKKIPGTGLQTLQEFLASLPADDAQAPQIDVLDIIEISNRFSTNPDNWIVKE